MPSPRAISIVSASAAGTVTCFVSGLGGSRQPVHSYLVTTPHGRALIDPAADLTPALTGTVAAILITHLQEENAAGCLNFPGVPVHIPAGDEYLCQGPAAYERGIANWPPPWEWETRGNYQGQVGGARNERPLPVPVPLAASLTGGTRFGEFDILATPGHGKHALTFLITLGGKRIGFCGDLVCGDGRLWNWFDAEWDFGLEGGQRALRASAARLRDAGADLLCPTHGPIVTDPSGALARLDARLAPIFVSPPGLPPTPPFDEARHRIAEVPSPAPCFRQLLPHLHQYNRNSGNCTVLLSETGNALLFDDGLCEWVPLPERKAFHAQAIAGMKAALGVRRIEIVIPTHCHGDHVENIPDLVAAEPGCEVVCLDVVADVLEHPERYNMVGLLPWYGTEHDVVHVDRAVPAGTRLRWHEYELDIFHLGGQTYYHSGIDAQIDGQRVLFVGDSFPRPPGIEPVLCYTDNDPETRGWIYAQRQMLARRPDLIVGAHAAALRDPEPVVRRKLAMWAQRLRQFRALAARPALREFFDPYLP